MSLKSAALLALIGTILLTVLVLAHFIFTVLGVMREVSPALACGRDCLIFRETQRIGVLLRFLPKAILILVECHIKPPKPY